MLGDFMLHKSCFPRNFYYFTFNNSRLHCVSRDEFYCLFCEMINFRTPLFTYDYFVDHIFLYFKGNLIGLAFSKDLVSLDDFPF